MYLDKFYKKYILIYSYVFLILIISGCNFQNKNVKETHLKLLNNKKDKYLKNFNHKIHESSQNKIEVMDNEWKRVSINSQIKEKKNEVITKLASYDNQNKNLYYINVSGGISNLKSYDVFDLSTNKAIWDDRYTNNGSSIEIGFGRKFGKFRLEISYAQEIGRFDEYLTYLDGSITSIESDKGNLHKDYYFLNTYFDFWNNKKINPFFGIGLGFLESSQDSAPFIPSYVRQVLVKQFKAGISIKSSESVSILLEAFIRDSNSHITSDGIGTSYSYEAKEGFDSEGIQLGLRKYF